MKCYLHRKYAATGVCSVCGKGVCSRCAVEIGGKLYCRADADKVFVGRLPERAAPLASAPKAAAPQEISAEKKIRETEELRKSAKREETLKKVNAWKHIGVAVGIFGCILVLVGMSLPWVVAYDKNTYADVLTNSGWQVLGMAGGNVMTSSYVVIFGMVIMLLSSIAMAVLPAGVEWSRHSPAEKAGAVLALGAIITFIGGAWALSQMSGATEIMAQASPYPDVAFSVGIGVVACLFSGILVLAGMGGVFGKLTALQRAALS